MLRRPRKKAAVANGTKLVQFAMTALDAGDATTAAARAREALASASDNALAWEVLSIALHRQGRLEEAIEAGRKAIELQPRAADFHTNLGVVLKAAGRPREAEAAYRAAIACDPAFAPAHHNLANLARDEKRNRDAERHYRDAIERKPSYGEAWHGLGIVLQRQGRSTEAEAPLRKAMALLPRRADVKSDLATCLMALERSAEAHELLRSAVESEPDLASAHGNLGALYLRTGRLLDAERATRRAAALAPGEARWISNLAVIAKDLGRFDEAEGLFRRALALKPDYTLAHANLLFCLNYHPTKSAEEIFAEYRRFDEVHARKHLPANLAFDNDRSPDRKLRIGYLSPDFREHSARHFLWPLMAHLDRRRIELFCYAEVAKPDRVTEEFKGLADHWRSTVGKSDGEVAAMIRADRIDVLMDCGGHTSESRILVLARKPAPVQVAYMLGHGYTSGLSAVDAFLGDEALTPKGCEHLFSERIVRLPRFPCAYVPPQGIPEVGPLPALKKGHVTFGHFGRVLRVNETVVAAWSKILHALPTARLVLNTISFADEECRRRFRDLFARHGIAAERVDLVFTSPQPKTWAAYGEIDIALDPFPHNAGTTTIEALWLGVPVVSLAARPSVGRFGASILASVGLSDWIAKDVDNYVAIAVAKARDVESLSRLRAGLRPRMAASPICDGPGLARDIETAFRTLWRDWCEGTSEAPKPAPTLAAALAAFQAGDLERAWREADKVIAQAPADGEARHLRGVAAYRLGRLQDAADDLARAANAMPVRADVRWNLTAMLRGLGRLPDAEAQGREAVRLAPDAPEAHNNLGSVLKDLGRHGEAEAHYRRAIALRPGYADAWSNLAWTLALAGNLKEAEAAARRALALNPKDVTAVNNLGTALLQQDRLPEAAECFERAVALKPDFAVAHSNLLFCLNYRTDLSGEQIFAAYRSWDAAHAAKLRPQRPVFANDRDPGRRLRVGYVSPDFRYHAVSFFIEEIMAAHDRSRFEITCYAEVANPDHVTERFKGYADRWRSTVGLGDGAVADLVRADGIDVLVDLAGHTGGNRLLAFARKPAPVQIANMIGSGTTTGLSAMDAVLADERLVPRGAEPFFSERVVRLSRLPQIYKPPEGMPAVAPLPASRNGYVTFGCFSRTVRINDGVVAAWARILKAVPDARLVLNSKPFREEESRQAWLARFASHGLAPERIELVYTTPQPRTWEAYGGIDIALDPFPHNAGTTTMEALWMGVPVVSLAGRPPVGRFGAAILGALGLDDWVTQSVDDYVARAVWAATDLPALAALRHELRPRFASSPLGSDAAGLAREIESAYRALWQEFCTRSP